jgi:GNAT superfamily N-acetyltransferase
MSACPPEPFALAAHRLGLAADGRLVTAAPLDPALAPQLASVFAGMEPWAAYPYPAAQLAAYLAACTVEAPRFAIHHDGCLVGVVGLRLDWLRGPYIQFLGVLAGAQGKGLGTVVLAWVEAEARRSGARNLWVAASDFNAGALRFYERAGFHRIADLEGLVCDDRTEVLLRMRLG